MVKKTLIIIFFIFLSQKNLYSESNFFSEGKKLFDNQDFEKAKFKFEQDIVFNPKSEKSYLYLAKIFKIENKDELEKNNLTTVILLNPKNEEAILNLANLYLKKSNFSETENYINLLSKICKNKCSEIDGLKKKLRNSLK
tara:strand:+ start:152 stop:571 length:420 start_codon:yes stop_codon:yes gene_type:complete